MPYRPYHWTEGSWQDVLICLTVMAIFTAIVWGLSCLLSLLNVTLSWIFFIGVGLWINALIVRIAFEPDVWDDPRMG